MTRRAGGAIDREVSTVLERTTGLASIPAPTGHESIRAELVASWWRADGWLEVDVDDAGNVWANVRRGPGGAIIVCAHLDTVFDATVRHGARREGERLVGPGVGDDSVGVAALSAVAGRLRRDGAHSVWLLATTGEEGLGNLRGIRRALERPPEPMAALVAVEGNYLGRVSCTGVGSERWRVTVRGPGGHAWEAANAPSAVHAVCELVARLVKAPPQPARVAVNVGRIGGGEAINARGREAWFEVDFRSEGAEALERLIEGSRVVVVAAGTNGIETSIEALGRRPAGGLPATHPLPRAAAQALAAVGVEPSFPATSTDANAAHAAGIPAVAVGVTTGAGEHTTAEWIDVGPLTQGIAALADTIDRFDGSLT